MLREMSLVLGFGITDNELVKGNPFLERGPLYYFHISTTDLGKLQFNLTWGEREALMEERHRSLWLSRRTALEMLRDRGYDVPEDEISTSLEEFKETYPNVHLVPRPLERLFTKGESALLLHFLEDSKLSVKNIKPILETAKVQGVTGILLIIKESMSSQVSEEIRSIKELEIEVFKESDLVFNVTKHELVPRHRIMAEEEKHRFLNERKLKENELPQIFVTDPVVRYFKGKKGDLVEIERKSETSGISYYYRVVV